MKLGVATVTLLAVACGKPAARSSDGGGIDAPVMPDANPSAPDPVTSLQQMPGNCSEDNWCWMTPTPNGNDYRQPLGTGPDNIWLTGWGTVLQWNGTSWIQHHPPVVAGELEGELPFFIGSTSSTNTWMIYETSLEHWDGTAWTIVETLSLGGRPGYQSLWVDPNGDAWVSYSAGMIKRWHDNAVAEQLTPSCGCTLGAIWGTSPTDVFVTIIPSGVLHYDGATFTQIYMGGDILSGFQGTTNDVWMNGATIQHWDGSNLSVVPETLSGTGLATLGYAASDDVWWWDPSGAFAHWNGSAITETPTSAPDAAYITSGTLIGSTYWLVGKDGEVATMDPPNAIHSVVAGGQWNELDGIWGAADNDMYFTVGPQLLHWDGTSFTPIPLDNGNPGDTTELLGLGGLGGSGADELFVSGFAVDNSTHQVTYSIFHFDGSAGTKAEVGSGQFLAPTVNEPFWFDVIGPGEALTTGGNGYAAYFSNGAWQTVTTSTTQELTGAFSPDPDHAWVSGLAGTALSWDRTNPLVMTQAPDLVTTADLGPIAGTPGDTWIADPSTPLMWHNSGSGWSSVSVPFVDTGGSTGGFIFTNPALAWFSSESQNHSRSWDLGSNFTFHDMGTTRPMPHIFQAPGTMAWASGESGIVLHAAMTGSAAVPRPAR